ncbi:MAG: peptide chain release factor N(5)-glutamine methyltransferase [Bacteroidaceae bacterium]|nr:peptide chain release factor N(5)-glutamine methyltransferase [Bacteroidaceae bacterium]
MPTPQTSTHNLYHNIVSRLADHFSSSEAQALARMIVEDYLNLPFPHVMAGISPALSVWEGQRLDLCISRLLADEPVQHIIGHCTFCGHTFSVNPSVLIPRPETEQLVSMAMSLPALPEHAVVMDACTGSGCIAVSLKKEKPEWQLYACDASTEALQTARENATLNETDIAFSQVDVLSSERPTGPFDIIVSNPPYVMDKEKTSMEPRVLKHEPHMALFVPDDNPLIFYKAIAAWGKQSLNPGGWVVVEINPLLAEETSDIFTHQGYENCEIINDIFGKQRFIRCQK